MTESIIIALITLAGTIISGVIGSISANRMVNYRIDQLEIKVDKHNNVIDRTYKVEQEIAVVKENLKNLEEYTHPERSDT